MTQQRPLPHVSPATGPVGGMLLDFGTLLVKGLETKLKMLKFLFLNTGSVGSRSSTFGPSVPYSNQAFPGNAMSCP